MHLIFSCKFSPKFKALIICDSTAITKTRPCNIQRFFTALKMTIFIWFFSYYFQIFAQKIDCGYTLEPPREAFLRSTHNLCFRAKMKKMYTPVNPSFTTCICRSPDRNLGRSGICLGQIGILFWPKVILGQIRISIWLGRFRICLGQMGIFK